MPTTTTPGAATRRLAAFAVNLGWADIPEPVRHEAKRSLLNYFASAVAGPGVSALFALAESERCDGRALLTG